MIQEENSVFTVDTIKTTYTLLDRTLQVVNCTPYHAY